MSWTKPNDVTGAWIGDDVPTDTEKLQVWIDKAEREIRRNVKDIQQRIDAELTETPERKDLLADAIDVAVAMVSRVFRNPTGARSVSENIGTGPISEQKSITLGGEMPGELALTSKELEKLQVAEESGGAFEIDLIPAGYQRPSAWD